MILGGTNNGDQSAYGIQIYPACMGSLAAGDVGDVLVDTNNYGSNSWSGVRKALAGGM